MSNQKLKSKVVVITGASAGVGRATAREFGKAGAKVALLARGVEALEQAKAEIESLGGEAIYFPIDVSHPEEIEKAADAIEEKWGAIDIWVNNAMVSVFGPFEEMTMKEFRRVTEVTYLGQVYGTKVALDKMRPRDKGSIVLVGSALAYRGIPLQSAYCGAKHGTQGFFDSLRSELLHDNSNIKLSMVQLPAMNTPQFTFVKNRLPNEPKPMGKIYQPEVAARAIVHAAIYGRRNMFVGYPTFQTIIGNKFFPAFGDYYLSKVGYKGQQTDQPKQNDKNNLWKPMEGDFGAHGNFDDKAHDKSFTLWVSKHYKSILAAAGIAVAAIGVPLLLLNSDDSEW